MIAIGIVVEDQYDGRAIAAIIERLLEGRARVRAIPAHGRSELERKAGRLIGLASRSTDCVLVIVDLDQDDPVTHPRLQAVRRACDEAPVRARLVGVAQELEAWLLADAAAVLAHAGASGGFSGRGQTDLIADPKRELSDVLLRLRRRRYSVAADAERLARRLDPAEVERWNASFRSFASLLRGCLTAEAAA